MPIKIYTESPFDFTKHSTIGCGGFAHLAYYPQNEEEVLYLLSTIQDAWVAVGNLSNVLPFDEGTKKTVICTKKLTEIREEREGIFVAAGVTSGALLRYMKDVGYTGAEFFAGIPCTLGGMLYMNGGGRFWFYDSTKAATTTGNVNSLPPMHFMGWRLR